MPFPGTESLPADGKERMQIIPVDEDSHRAFVGASHSIALEDVTRMASKPTQGGAIKTPAFATITPVIAVASEQPRSTLKINDGFTAENFQADMQEKRLMTLSELAFVQAHRPIGAKAAIEWGFAIPEIGEQPASEFFGRLAASVVAVDARGAFSNPPPKSYEYAELVPLDDSETEMMLVLNTQNPNGEGPQTQLMDYRDELQQYEQNGILPIAKIGFGPLPPQHEAGQATDYHALPWHIDGLGLRPAQEGDDSQPTQPEVVGMIVDVAGTITDKAYYNTDQPVITLAGGRTAATPQQARMPAAAPQQPDGSGVPSYLKGTG